LACKFSLVDHKLALWFSLVGVVLPIYQNPHGACC
jgi:hypothetical protein